MYLCWSKSSISIYWKKNLASTNLFYTNNFCHRCINFKIALFQLLINPVKEPMQPFLTEKMRKRIKEGVGEYAQQENKDHPGVHFPILFFLILTSHHPHLALSSLTRTFVPTKNLPAIVKIRLKWLCMYVCTTLYIQYNTHRWTYTVYCLNERKWVLPHLYSTMLGTM